MIINRAIDCIGVIGPCDSMQSSLAREDPATGAARTTVLIVLHAHPACCKLSQQLSRTAVAAAQRYGPVDLSLSPHPLKNKAEGRLSLCSHSN
jgi:hypothetical protein